MAVYSGFAIVLTTLIWVYLSWEILLIGAGFAFYLQFPQYLRHGQEAIELNACAQEQIALSVMYLIARDYTAGVADWTPDRLAAQLEVPGSALAPILVALERASLTVATEKESLVPGREPGHILLMTILDVARSTHAGRSSIEVQAAGPTGAVLDEVHAAMREGLGERSLKDLIAAV
jgi:membrane protein